MQFFIIQGMENERDTSYTTVLVVDDLQVNVELILGYLKETRYTFHTAKDGREAWNLLVKYPQTYSAVLLDRVMPKLDGLGVLKMMKSHQDLRQIPVIFQTSMTRERDIIEGIQAGAYYYLAKPFKKKILKAIVKSAVNDFEQYRSLTKQAVEITNAVTLLKTGKFVFRTLEEGRKLSTLMGSICPGLDMSVVGIWELIVNAVEHGNLGIAYKEKSRLNENDQWEVEVSRRLQLPENVSKTVTLEVERETDIIRFTIQDQGGGFDWRSYMDFSPERAFDSHGRGIAMANHFSFDKIEYQGCGNRVKATVKCPLSSTSS